MRHYRRLKNKKQKEIGPILGVDRTTVVSYEKQSSLEVSADQADKLASFLGVSLEDLQQEVEQNVPRGTSDGDDEYIKIHRDVWHELKENNKTYKESLEKLIQTLDRTMDNLSKPANRKN